MGITLLLQDGHIYSFYHIPEEITRYNGLMTNLIDIFFAFVISWMVLYAIKKISD
jgi:hypothetical protein